MSILSKVGLDLLSKGLYLYYSDVDVVGIVKSFSRRNLTWLLQKPYMVSINCLNLNNCIDKVKIVCKKHSLLTKTSYSETTESFISYTNGKKILDVEGC